MKSRKLTKSQSVTILTLILPSISLTSLSLSSLSIHRLALRLHPDKILSLAPSTETNSSTSSSSDLSPTQLFQRLSFSYSILSDPTRRSRYDSTGKTSEPGIGSEDFDWNQYFQTLWTGEVSGDKLREFKLGYQSEFTVLALALGWAGLLESIGIRDTMERWASLRESRDWVYSVGLSNLA